MLGWLGKKVRSSDSLVSTVIGLQVQLCLNFSQVLEIQTQILMLAQNSVYVYH